MPEKSVDEYDQEDDRRVAMDQGRVTNIAVPDHPANIRRCPEHIARVHVVDVLHCPIEGHKVARSGAYNALWGPGRTGGIENISRVISRNRQAIGGRGAVAEGVPIDVAGAHLGPGLIDLGLKSADFILKVIDPRYPVADFLLLLQAAQLCYGPFFL